MAYTTNPNMPKVRRDAVNLVKYRGWSMHKVALRFGVNVGTISRWCKRGTGWNKIETQSSRPKTSPKALGREVISLIIQKRIGRRRCGQVIHQELLREGVKISLPSVQRTLNRLGLLKKRSPWKRPHDSTPRPVAEYPGALMQADTIHIVLPDGSRMYVYTLIDLCSRWAYAEIVDRIGAEASIQFIARAQKQASFKFKMIQTDHGSEFSIWFTHGLWTIGLSHRHSRVRQSNDNAHIERFNRTIQEECLDKLPRKMEIINPALKKYLEYYNTERLHMGISFLSPIQLLNPVQGID